MKLDLYHISYRDHIIYSQYNELWGQYNAVVHDRHNRRIFVTREMRATAEEAVEDAKRDIDSIITQSLEIVCSEGAKVSLTDLQKQGEIIEKQQAKTIQAQAARIAALEAENKELMALRNKLFQKGIAIERCLIEAGRLIEGYWRGRRLLERFYQGVTDEHTIMWQDTHYSTEELALLKDTEEYLEFLKEGGE